MTPVAQALDSDVAVNIMEYLKTVLPDDCVFVLAVARPVEGQIVHQVMSDAPRRIILAMFRAFLNAARSGEMHKVTRDQKKET